MISVLSKKLFLHCTMLYNALIFILILNTTLLIKIFKCQIVEQIQVNKLIHVTSGRQNKNVFTI